MFCLTDLQNCEKRPNSPQRVKPVFPNIKCIFLKPFGILHKYIKLLHLCKGHFTVNKQDFYNRVQVDSASAKRRNNKKYFIVFIFIHFFLIAKILGSNIWLHFHILQPLPQAIIQ